MLSSSYVKRATSMCCLYKVIVQLHAELSGGEGGPLREGETNCSLGFPAIGDYRQGYDLVSPDDRNDA